ncbi:ABC transporter ATP-binding protein [Gordonia bronchialis]|uniref:ABC transporter ATP-binding protein n=1 Tax=Gordonia bronchialis TaxID=2054 RepID=UPI00226ECE10|nr:ABC transporter ATP-binding protein [Gordonia bronchialis]
MTLEAKGLSWSRGGNLVLDDVTLRPTEGETIGILGPNGSGKSSLLRALGGLAHPQQGTVTLEGTDIRRLRRRQIARRVAMVSQHATTDVDLAVIDVVRLGRIPHSSAFGGDDEGERVVADAIARTGLTDKAHDLWHTLSGGEQQRAQIARALAQEPRELLLDEPTNHRRRRAENGPYQAEDRGENTDDCGFGRLHGSRGHQSCQRVQAQHRGGQRVPVTAGEDEESQVREHLCAAEQGQGRHPARANPRQCRQIPAEPRAARHNDEERIGIRHHPGGRGVRGGTGDGRHDADEPATQLVGHAKGRMHRSIIAAVHR